MNKIMRYFKVCAVITLSYLLILYIGYMYNLQQHDSLHEWIIGTWQAEREYTDNLGVHRDEIQVEFLRSGILVYSSTLSRELEFGVVLRYNFNSNNRLALNGRLQDEWKITQEGAYLSIEGGIWENEGITFRRSFGFGRLIVLVMAMIIIGITLYKPPPGSRFSDNQFNEDKLSGGKNVLRMISVLGIDIIIFAIGYKMGEFVANQISIKQILLHQGLPWYPIILIEIFLVFLLLGMKVAEVNQNLTKSSNLLVNAKHYLGILLIGSSVYGIFIGLVRLAVLFFLPLTLKYII